jgi:hypothetical protein
MDLDGLDDAVLRRRVVRRSASALSSSSDTVGSRRPMVTMRLGRGVVLSVMTWLLD